MAEKHEPPPDPRLDAGDNEKEDFIDWNDLRVRSIQPGGFGADRVEIWRKLLHVEHQDIVESPTPAYGDDTSENQNHPDEHQIKLDTDRSFVLYPQDLKRDRETLQLELHELLLAVFRRRPKLSYFQGYHDIVTVLFLTLPPELQVPCTEKLSLQRLRDSMGAGLEPILGLIRFMQELLRVVDPPYAELLESTSPLPYFALSNILTLFSHDMPNLPLVQRVFDFLLCRPPIAVVYLATALTLCRKDEVMRLEEEGEEGMVHSLLSGLPDITDGDENPKEEIDAEDDVKEDGPAGDDLLVASTKEIKVDEEVKKEPKDDIQEQVIPTETDSHEPAATASHEVKDEERSHNLDEPPTPPSPSSPPVYVAVSPAGSSTPSLPPVEPSIKDEETDGDANSSSATVPNPERLSSRAPRRPAVSLSSLLSTADALMEQYPPDSPSLCLSRIMGPQSVIFTWSTNPSDMPSDDEAEKMVAHPELVVYPYVPEEPSFDDDMEKEKQDARKRRRKLVKRQPDRRTMIVGAVLVLGVAMAVYGAKTGAYKDAAASRVAHAHAWRKFGKWLMGTGQRVIQL